MTTVASVDKGSGERGRLRVAVARGQRLVTQKAQHGAALVDERGVVSGNQELRGHGLVLPPASSKAARQQSSIVCCATRVPSLEEVK